MRFPLFEDKRVGVRAAYIMAAAIIIGAIIQLFPPLIAERINNTTNTENPIEPMPPREDTLTPRRPTPALVEKDSTVAASELLADSLLEQRELEDRPKQNRKPPKPPEPAPEPLELRLCEDGRAGSIGRGEGLLTIVIADFWKRERVYAVSFIIRGSSIGNPIKTGGLDVGSVYQIGRSNYDLTVRNIEIEEQCAEVSIEKVNER